MQTQRTDLWTQWGKDIACYAKSLQSCLTLCDPMDYDPTGSSVHGILQVRIVEWVATSSSRGSSQPRDRTHFSYVSCVDRLVLYHNGGKKVWDEFSGTYTYEI